MLKISVACRSAERVQERHFRGEAAIFQEECYLPAHFFLGAVDLSAALKMK
ncbi:MAG: hypothetical protein ACI9G1_001407 [Pirellulaceae bacterium]|jgi:hypothetical protein